jgi:UDP-N-acetylglucosamine acyltransferase
VRAKGFVDGTLVVEAEQTFSLVDPPTKKQIEATAFIHPSAELGKDVYVGPYATVGEGVKIGDGTRVEAHAVIEKWTEIGKNCQIHYAAVIGSASQDKKHAGVKSYVKIGDNNHFREYVSINRATAEGDATVIGHNNLFLSYVHVGHDCQLGSQIVVSNGTQIAGHVSIDDSAVLGGMVGVNQFVRIGSMVMVGGYSKVNQDVPPYLLCEGNPAVVRTINLVGLQRNQLNPDIIRDLKRAYRMVFRSDLNITQAIARIREELPATAEIEKFISFFQAPTKAGVIRRVIPEISDDDGD